MTIHFVESNGKCCCTWFVRDMHGNWESEPKWSSFPPDVLDVIKAGAGHRHDVVDAKAA